jgi:hypothetical protein
MLVIDAKNSNEDGMGTGRMYKGFLACFTGSRLVIDGKYSSDDGLSTTVKMEGSECACEDSAETRIRK